MPGQLPGKEVPGAEAVLGGGGGRDAGGGEPAVGSDVRARRSAVHHRHASPWKEQPLTWRT